MNMKWLLLLAHGFHPFLMLFTVAVLREDESSKDSIASTVFTAGFTNLFMYGVWVGGLFLLVKVTGRAFSLHALLGGDSLAAFAPHVFGLIYLLCLGLVNPRLSQEGSLHGIVSTVGTLCGALGVYSLGVFFLKWAQQTFFVSH